MSVCSSVKFILVEKTVLYSQPKFCPPPAECRFPMVIKKNRQNSKLHRVSLAVLLAFLALVSAVPVRSAAPVGLRPGRVPFAAAAGFGLFLAAAAASAAAFRVLSTPVVPVGRFRAGVIAAAPSRVARRRSRGRRQVTSGGDGFGRVGPLAVANRTQRARIATAQREGASRARHPSKWERTAGA